MLGSPATIEKKGQRCLSQMSPGLIAVGRDDPARSDLPELIGRLRPMSFVIGGGSPACRRRCICARGRGRRHRRAMEPGWVPGAQQWTGDSDIVRPDPTTSSPGTALAGERFVALLRDSASYVVRRRAALSDSG